MVSDDNEGRLCAEGNGDAEEDALDQEELPEDIEMGYREEDQTS